MRSKRRSIEEEAEELEREERPTIPAPQPLEQLAAEGAPTWALALVSEVRELRGALASTGEMLVEHTVEMQGLATATQRLELAIYALEGRAIRTDERLRPLEHVVLPLLQKDAA